MSDRGSFCTGFIYDPEQRDTVRRVLAEQDGITILTPAGAGVVAGMTKGLGAMDDYAAIDKACTALAPHVTDPLLVVCVSECGSYHAWRIADKQAPEYDQDD